MADNKMTKKTIDTLLEIAKLIALSDGNISKEEAQLIRDLPQQLSVDTVEADLVHPAEGSTLILKELVGALTTHEDRCLAARVAYLVAAVSRQPVIASRSIPMNDACIKNSLRSSICQRMSLRESSPQPSNS